MNNKWISVKVLAAPFLLESLSAPIFALGAQGVQEEEQHFTIFFADHDWNQDVYLTLLKLLKEVWPDFEESRLIVETHKTENWLENWKENFKPFRVGQSIVVIPDWEEYPPAAGEIVLKIAPKMAFGTGHHETTRLCLQAMEAHFNPSMRLLDAGTGSGILSIFAAKKGATGILGVDNDPLAIENARENARLNGVEDKIRFAVQDVALLSSGAFDFIVANISRNILLILAKTWPRLLAPGGQLLLSGFLKQDQNIIEKKYLARGFKPVTALSLGEWLALLFQKEKAR